MQKQPILFESLVSQLQHVAFFGVLQHVVKWSPSQRGVLPSRYDECMPNVCPYPCIYTLPSGRIRTMNAQWTHKQRKAFARQPCIPCKSQECFAISLRQSCEITRLPHGCLAAAVRILRFSFPRIKLRISHDPQGCRTSVALLPCDVYDIIGPVWIFEKIVCDLSTARSTCQIVRQNGRTINVKQALPTRKSF